MTETPETTGDFSITHVYGFKNLPKFGIKKVFFLTQKADQPQKHFIKKVDMHISSKVNAFIKQKNAMTLDHPVPLPDKMTLYVDHKGELLLANHAVKNVEQRQYLGIKVPKK